MIVKSSRLNTGILRHANGMFPQWACIELSNIRVLNHNHTQSVPRVFVIIIIIIFYLSQVNEHYRTAVCMGKSILRNAQQNTALTEIHCCRQTLEKLIIQRKVIIRDRGVDSGLIGMKQCTGEAQRHCRTVFLWNLLSPPPLWHSSANLQSEWLIQAYQFSSHVLNHVHRKLIKSEVLCRSMKHLFHLL